MSASKTLGDRLRDARVARDLGLRELARELAIAPSYLSDIESDRRVPSEDVLQRLAKKLGLEFDAVMALAGRVGEEAERYLRREPAAGAVFRKIAEKKLSPDKLDKVSDFIDDLEKGKKKGRP